MAEKKINKKILQKHEETLKEQKTGRCLEE